MNKHTDAEYDVLAAEVRKVAGSKDNEATSYPLWFILDPRQMMSPCVSTLADMFHGPFFSRESAEDYVARTRYRYGKHVVVWCASAYSCPDYRRLYEVSERLHGRGEDHLKMRKLQSETGCGLKEAMDAMRYRDGDYECALEMLNRCRLAAVMSDATRYPIWTARQAATAAQRDSEDDGC